MTERMVWALELATGVFSTLIAAFLGARVAFALERKRDMEKQRDLDADGLQAAIFVLCRQLTIIAKIRSETLEDLRHDKDRHMLLPPLSAKIVVSARIDFNWVSHMLRGHEDCAGLAFLFMASDDSVDSLYQTAEARRAFFLGQVQPRLEEAGIAEFTAAQAEEVRAVYGEADAELMRRYTDRLYEACDTAIHKLERALVEARRISPIAFPGYDFKFVLPEWVQQIPR